MKIYLIHEDVLEDEKSFREMSHDEIRKLIKNCKDDGLIEVYNSLDEYAYAFNQGDTLDPNFSYFFIDDTDDDHELQKHIAGAIEKWDKWCLIPGVCRFAAAEDMYKLLKKVQNQVFKL